VATVPPYKRAGFGTQNGYAKARKEAKAWSDHHSRSESSRYFSRMTPEQFRAYYDAYVSVTTGRQYVRARNRKAVPGPGRYIKKYLLMMNFVAKEEFDDRYPVLA